MPADASSSSERLRIWLERGESGYWLRDAATSEAVRWNDARLLVVPVAGASYRLGALDDPGFSPGRRYCCWTSRAPASIRASVDRKSVV